MTDSFTIQEIADWQLHRDNDTSKVELPSIQRGFVWKPKQVEDLWDSLLRGYPIGSFLFSKAGENLYLMDGQQRSTSIFLGHFNPFNQLNETKAWVIKGELPVVWIDLKPYTKPDSSKYLVRLTTRSHPWGYQASNNDSKLSVSDRRTALKLFRQHPDNQGGYTLFKNSTVFPFDANYPIPLCFFIESQNIEEVIEKIRLHLPNYFSTKEGGFENKDAFLILLENDLKQELSEIFDEIKKTKEVRIKSNIIDDRVLNEESDSDNPTLFVRINSAGTKLTRDDLIYSIYKAAFPDLKNLIENIGINFISPTQVLSLVSRLVASDSENNNYVEKLNVRDFQRKIKNTEFKKKLNKLIQTNEIKNLFDKAIKILSCKDNSLFEGEIPPIIIKQFIKKHQELFLFFIYWLYLHKENIDEKIELKMVSKLLLFVWFDFGKIPRLWKEKIKNKNFWNETVNELICWGGVDGIHFPIEPELLKKYYEQGEVINMFRENNEHKWKLLQVDVGSEIIEYYKSIKSEEIDITKANEFFGKFIHKIKYNKQMILFAQRECINSTFGDFNQMDEIEDTNIPWDWDHIYPNSWVYNMKDCEQIIRDWNETNGNFRAISLEQNRSEGNSNSPKKRLENEVIRNSSFVFENDWKHWQEIDKRIRDKNKAISHFKAITTRMINIYEKFWNDLKIDELLKEK